MQHYFVKFLAFLIISLIANGISEKRILIKTISIFGASRLNAKAKESIENTKVRAKTEIRIEIQNNPVSFR